MAETDSGVKYFVGHRVAGGGEYEISETLYLHYRDARAVLSSCLAIEEKYEILISNYLELENQILQIATSHMVRGEVGYAVFFDLRLLLNMRLANILTAARLYLDQLPTAVRTCLFDQPDPSSDVKTLLSEQYDGNIHYRFMEALRNFVQHHGLAVHWTSLPSQWTDRTETALMEFNLEFASRKSVLSDDRAFKRSILSELPDQIDLKVAVRSYIESISSIHDGVRELIAASVDHARAQIDGAYHEYERVAGEENASALSAYKSNGVTVLESYPLARGWDNIRIELQKRNRKLTNLHKRYATGRPTPLHAS